MDKPATSRFLIQLDRPGEKLDLGAVGKLLEGIEIELDPGYGPILINPKLGRYVVRGTATPEGRARAEAIPGVRFFADSPVKPIAS